MITLRLDERTLNDLIDGLLPRLLERIPLPDRPVPVRYLAAGEVAKLVGFPSRKALEMRLVRARKRGGCHPLEQIAIQIDGLRRWREADVVAWIEASR